MEGPVPSFILEPEFFITTQFQFGFLGLCYPLVTSRGLVYRKMLVFLWASGWTALICQVFSWGNHCLPMVGSLTPSLGVQTTGW